jgi:hypothetical protein
MARRRSCVAHADYDVLSREVLLKPGTGPLRIQLLPPAARMASEGESANRQSYRQRSQYHAGQAAGLPSQPMACIMAGRKARVFWREA